MHVSGSLYEAIKYGVKMDPVMEISRFGHELKDRKDLSERWTEEEETFGRKIIEKRLSEGIWRELDTSSLEREPHCISEEFLVFKEKEIDRSDGNFSHLTSFFDCPKMKYDVLEEVLVDIRKNDYLLSWDFKSGYNHFRLHPSMRKLLLVNFMGRFFQNIALPFGWGPSGYWFIKITR